MTRILPALILALAVSAPAVAQDRLPDTRVGYGDLNLRSQQGVNTLKRRISLAVDSACGVRPGATLLSQMAIHRCRAEKNEQVSRQVSDVLARASREATGIASLR